MSNIGLIQYEVGNMYYREINWNTNWRYASGSDCAARIRVTVLYLHTHLIIQVNVVRVHVRVCRWVCVLIGVCVCRCLCERVGVCECACKVAFQVILDWSSVDEMTFTRHTWECI